VLNKTINIMSANRENSVSKQKRVRGEQEILRFNCPAKMACDQCLKANTRCMMMPRSSSRRYRKRCAACTRAGRPCNPVSCKSGLLNSLILVSFLLSGTGDELDKMRAQLDVDSELSRSRLNTAIGTLQTVLLEAISALSQWQKVETAKERLGQHVEDMVDFHLEDLYAESGVSEVSGVADPIASDMSHEAVVAPEVSEVLGEFNESGLDVVGSLEDLGISLEGLDGLVEGAES